MNNNLRVTMDNRENKIAAGNPIVRANLMTVSGYTPYCGGPSCCYNQPRTNWDKDKEQFTCKCGWVSKFPHDFISLYKEKWEKINPHEPK